MQLPSFTRLLSFLWIFAIAFPNPSFQFIGIRETTDADIDANTESYNLNDEAEIMPRRSKWNNTLFEVRIRSYIDYGRHWQKAVVANKSRFLEEVDEYLTRLPSNASKIVTTQSRDVCHCEGKIMMPCPLRCLYGCYVQNTDSYTVNNGWRHEDDCRGIKMLDCKCHQYSNTTCYNYKDNLLNCINRSTEYVKADRYCSQYSINKPDLVRSYDLILNLLMEPLKMYFRSVESRLSFLNQATFTIDSLSNIAGLRCGMGNDEECASGIDQLLSEEEDIFNEMRTNFTLELFKIQSKIHSTSSKVDKLKQGTFDTINRAIKGYSCCLKSLDFSVDDYDCSDVTNIYPTAPPDCGCDPLGSYGPTCNSEGSCSCKPQFEGKLCNKCKDGYYNYPLCAECDCDTRGSSNQTCNSEGQCYCKSEIEGKKCDKCRNGFYYYPQCTGLTTTETTTKRPNARSRCLMYHSCHRTGWAYGQIPCDRVCNYVQDCNDGSDENDC